jgi:hypothetical protein
MAESAALTRLKELYLPPSDRFVVIDIPDMQFAMIDGQGDPDGETFRRSMTWLFAAIYPLKRIAKQRMGRDFVCTSGRRRANARRSRRCTASSCRHGA